MQPQTGQVRQNEEKCFRLKELDAVTNYVGCFVQNQLFIVSECPSHMKRYQILHIDLYTLAYNPSQLNYIKITSTGEAKKTHVTVKKFQKLRVDLFKT